MARGDPVAEHLLEDALPLARRRAGVQDAGDEADQPAPSAAGKGEK